MCEQEPLLTELNVVTSNVFGKTNALLQLLATDAAGHNLGSIFDKSRSKHQQYMNLDSFIMESASRLVTQQDDRGNFAVRLYVFDQFAPYQLIDLRFSYGNLFDVFAITHNLVIDGEDFGKLSIDAAGKPDIAIDILRELDAKLEQPYQKYCP